ncbi:recombinase RecT [Listeria monocytogenes]|uniref:RecT family recombinase n=1 Tax=Listeria monocytogenes TaxID=1639 RepID=UPI000868670E|nr:RecT family recombinase [Listeria monocytogenes]EAG6272510.1 recombinase RecT [Listeria monocytogenes CFSAN003726]EAG6360633.1 recombinase RecT [Listeria monocytogenes CFSAN003729]EAG6369637.1 recombinase RecT [Listeria monocytogenes CFSAN003728]EAC3320307.1 recombinase RecT [Listeria monocytogenes]EAC4721696.1 recombinase RecT [Listeria monocytogenes]
MTNEVMNQPNSYEVANFDEEKLRTMQQTIAKGSTPQEFELFVQVCKNSGLNPFLNHVYFIKYGNQMNIQISVEGVEYLARRSEGYKGIDVQLVHEKDEIRFSRNDQGVMTVTKHEFGFPRGKVTGGYAIARRENFPDFVVVMDVSEVEHLKNGTNKAMWGKYFNDMFKKHLIKRAAKTQYGVEIGEDELLPSGGIANEPEYDPSQRKDITPENKAIEMDEGESKSEEELKEEKWDLIQEKLKAYGLEREYLSNLIASKFAVKPQELSLPQIVALGKLIDLEQRDANQGIEQPEPSLFDLEPQE